MPTGLCCRGATSPYQALALLKERSYGLALIDLDLSGDDGYEPFVKMPRIPGGSDECPGTGCSKGRGTGQPGGADAFVKPLDLDEIRETLVRSGHGEMPGSVWPAAPKPDGEAQSSF